MDGWTKAALFERLTPRQVEVLALVAQRFSSKEIGRQLNLSPKTIDRHVEEINARLGLSSRSEAGRAYLEALVYAGEELPMGMTEVAPPPPRAPHIVVPEGEPLEAIRGAEPPPPPQGALHLLKRFFTPPPVGGRRHELTLTQRLATAGQIGLIAIIVIAAIVTVLMGILDLLGR